MVGVEQDGSKSVAQKTQEHNQALYRQQQIDQQNAQLRQQRQQAPSNIKEGTFEAQQIKQQEAQDAQQAYFGGNYQQRGSSADQFVAQREAALKSGKFDYSAVRSSFYSPPETFVNTKGERVSRTDYKPPVKEPVSFGQSVSGTPIEKPSMPVLKISSSELQKSNALRASQGLPPLEQVTTVQIVSPTKGPTTIQPVSRLSTEGKAPVQTFTGETTTLYGKTFPIFTPSGEKSSGAAVSFLRYPFSPNKGASSGGIQSTTILDPLQFLGIEAGVSLAVKGAAFVGSLIRSEGKTIIKEGAKDIGLNIKPSEAYLKAKSFEAQAARLPPPATIKPTVTPKTPTVPIFTSTEVNLGKGLGISTGEKGGTSATDLFKPSPPGKPSSTGTKEVTVGKGGLTQIVKEKPPVQKQVTQMKETQLKLGSGQVKQIQKTKTVTLKEKPNFEQKQLQKQDQFLRQKLKPRQKQEQLILAKPLQRQTQQFKQPSKQRQKQDNTIPLTQKQARQTGVIPINTESKLNKTTGIIGGSKQKQGQTMIGISDKINISLTKGTGPSNPKPDLPQPTIPNKPQTTGDNNKRTGFDALLGSAKSGGLGKVSKSGARKGYIGNVPIESLVGVYKRSEVTYTNKSSSQLNKKQKATSNRNFKLLGSKSIKI